MMSWDRDLPAIDAAAAAARGWDVAVIGAGPAGTIAAFHLARSGARVLLVEKQRFPRPKVCGCCLNAAALELLSGCGLADLPYRAAAQRLWALELSARGRTALLRLPTGAALSRERLDALLASEAIRAGATFLPGTSAAVGAIESNGRGVSMSNAGQEFRTTPRIIVVADGLSGRALRHCPDFKSFTAAHSRVGGNTTLPGPVSDMTPASFTWRAGAADTSERSCSRMIVLTWPRRWTWLSSNGMAASDSQLATLSPTLVCRQFRDWKTRAGTEPHG